MKKDTRNAIKKLQNEMRRKRAKSRKLEDCICKKEPHTEECIKNHKRNQLKRYFQKRKEKRKINKENHICTWGGCYLSVEPTIIYHQFCDKHRIMANEITRRSLNNKKEESK